MSILNPKKAISCVMLKIFFRKLFGIYPGEERNALIFASLGFLWSLGVTAGLKFADALFLLHIGADHLPGMYTMTSCGMIVLASLLLYLYHYIPVNRIYLCAMAIGICFYLFACFCVVTLTGTETGWLWYMLRIFGSLFFTVTLTCYWTFIDQYYPLQDAKRLYCLYSSVIFLGYATTGTVMRSGLVDIPVLTLSIATLLAITGTLILWISRNLQPVHDESHLEDINVVQREKYSLKKLLKTIATSRFTLLLMAGNFMTYVLLVLTEYNYLSSFQHYYDPDGITALVGNEEDSPLTQFLGQWLAIVSVVNIIFGLFLYSRIIRRYGIGSLLVCTPIIWLVVFAGWSFSDSLFFPILGIFVVEGTLNVIDDNNFNLLLSAIPAKIKNKTRVIIESFFEPVGVFVSSLLLDSSWINSKYLGLGLSACFLTIILFQRRQYVKAIYRNLTEHALHFERSLADWLTPYHTKQLMAYASSNQPLQFFAAKGIAATGDERLLNDFFANVEDLNQKEELRKSLFPLQAEEFIPMEQLVQMVDDPTTAHKAARLIARQASPAHLSLAPILVKRLRHLEDSELTVAYLTALGKMESASLAKPIVEASIHFRPNERRLTESIVTKMGPTVITPLFALLKDPSCHDRCRTLAGKILSRLAIKDLREALFEVLTQEIDKAYFYFYHYCTVQKQYPDIDLHLLEEGLLTGYHSSMDLIIQLLGAAGELEDTELLSRALRSPHPKTRSQVVEALEKTCETRLFRLLQPLVMDMPESEKIKLYIREDRQPLSLQDIIARLAYSPSPVDQIIVATLKKELNFPHWRDELRVHINDKDPLFQHFVTELLDS